MITLIVGMAVLGVLYALACVGGLHSDGEQGIPALVFITVTLWIPASIQVGAWVRPWLAWVLSR